MSLQYSKVLIIGATSGIGHAYAEKVVQSGKHVIIVGRRKENLDEFVSKHGANKVDSVVFDITKLDEIPRFVKDITNQHPDLDCIMINSGVQRGLNFAKPETVDLSEAELEFTTNYTAYLHLTKAFVPFLQKQNKETALVYTSSGLALLPLTRCPNYSATKAALHHFILALREQLADGPGKIKVVEVFPPAVQTELHDEKHQPDIKDGRNYGMPLNEFTEESWTKLVQGDEQIPVGFSKDAFDKFEMTRQEMYQSMVKSMKQQKST